jgi:hypothetical protein
MMTHAVRFREGNRQLTLVFVYNCRGLWIVESEKHVVLEPKVAKGWQRFLMRELHSIDIDNPPIVSPPY